MVKRFDVIYLVNSAYCTRVVIVGLNDCSSSLEIGSAGHAAALVRVFGSGSGTGPQNEGEVTQGSGTVSPLKSTQSGLSPHHPQLFDSTMLDILRDSTVGSIINSLSHGRLLPFPDQRDDFQIPKRYLAPTISSQNANSLPQALTSVPRRPDSIEGSDEKTLPVASLSLDEGRSAQLDIQSVKTAGSSTGGEIMVDWYGEDDPENPRNWSLKKRIFVTSQIAFLTYVPTFWFTLSRRY